MITDPRPEPRSWTTTLHRWYTVAWLCFGIAPSVIGLRDEPGAAKYLAAALLVVLCLGYWAVRVLPANPVLRPTGYLAVLALILGAMAALPGGGAALLIVSLPQFWIFGPGRRVPIALAGLATAATAAGAVVASEDFPMGPILFTVGGYIAAVLLGLFVGRVVEDGEARARRLAAELAVAEGRLAEAHRSRGAAEERERLAREIHDTIAQGLASIVVLAEAARADGEGGSRQLTSIERTARENLAEARALVSAGHDTGLQGGSFADTLRRVLDRFAEDTGLTVEAELPDVDLDRHTRVALLRCAQESLANVRKHAEATTVSVLVAARPGAIELEITDDGRGFVPGPTTGFGLRGMRARLAELGGELTLTTSPGEGTRVLATVPAEE
ncbi:hypothetical protein Afil01_30400 [Actinorhabdospora filicis]|uniref:Histidine kinase/HSP90-like ATPase domain-containing protein n=1 Tax=Actinorhabdospora filicis TaxID=1785913 RepID=A0A9W6W9Q2_9ACTN|nr:sensor histidine kinase [Actinorhabdospora filicis]GLZ78233.1 hypothetical protein Afil01_30400 [Actinorhabdospora filicis]